MGDMEKNRLEQDDLEKVTGGYQAFSVLGAVPAVLQGIKCPNCGTLKFKPVVGSIDCGRVTFKCDGCGYEKTED